MDLRSSIGRPLGALLLVLALAAGGALVLLGPSPHGPSLGLSVCVKIRGPSKELLFEGWVHPPLPTVLSALLESSRVGNFTVLTREYPMGTYVYSIAGFEAHGSSGWVYAIVKGTRVLWGDVAANLKEVEEGESTLWMWSESEETLSQGSGDGKIPCEE